jgi:glycosyltransferase involved in cell wall biosynthesis
MNSARVGIVLPSLKFGGGERVSLNLAHGLKKSGYQVDLLVMAADGELMEEAKLNFNVIDLSANRTYKLPTKLLRYTFRYSPIAVISNYPKISYCACLARILNPRYKLIVWEHSPPSATPFLNVNIYSFLSTLLYPFATKIIAVSKGVSNDIMLVTRGLSHKIKTIYNPIIFPNKEQQSAKNEFNEPPTIISVGRLTEQKNHKLLIEAFAVVTKIRPAKLKIVGDGELRLSLMDHAERLEISHLVEFTGYSKNPYEHLYSADLFVLSSNYEGLPTVIIEALHAGLPIVSTDCPSGPNEILMSGKYGSLVPMNDSRSLANAILRELTSRRAVKDQIEGAQRFDATNVTRKFIEIIEENI